MVTITGHVFRRIWTGGRANRTVRRLADGMCAFNGTCNQPADAHIGAEEFRARRGAR